MNNEQTKQRAHLPAPDGEVVVPLSAVLRFVDLIATGSNGLRHEYVESRSGSMVKVPDFHAIAHPAPVSAGEAVDEIMELVDQYGRLMDQVGRSRDATRYARNKTAVANAVGVLDQIRQRLAHPAPSVSAWVPNAVALAYGLLWHVNAGMDAPWGTPSLTPERASMESRKLLREMLTSEQRGDGISAARDIMKALAAEKEKNDE